jgi:hypothetical protein
MASSIAAFCQRVQAGIANATFAPKRCVVAWLIDRIVFTHATVTIRDVRPQPPRTVPVHFCPCRQDYFHDIIQILHLADGDPGAVLRTIALDGRGIGVAPVNRHPLPHAMPGDGLRRKRLAACSSRASASRKSMVWPVLSTTRYR